MNFFFFSRFLSLKYFVEIFAIKKMCVELENLMDKYKIHTCHKNQNNVEIDTVDKDLHFLINTCGLIHHCFQCFQIRDSFSLFSVGYSGGSIVRLIKKIIRLGGDINRVYENGLNVAMKIKNKQLFKLFYDIKVKKKSRDVNFKFLPFIRGDPFYVSRIVKLISYKRLRSRIPSMFQSFQKDILSGDQVLQGNNFKFYYNIGYRFDYDIFWTIVKKNPNNLVQLRKCGYNFSKYVKRLLNDALNDKNIRLLNKILENSRYQSKCMRFYKSVIRMIHHKLLIAKKNLKFVIKFCKAFLNTPFYQVGFSNIIQTRMDVLFVQTISNINFSRMRECGKTYKKHFIKVLDNFDKNVQTFCPELGILKKELNNKIREFVVIRKRMYFLLICAMPSSVAYMIISYF